MSKIISIAIDGNEANVAQRVGSNVYAYEILCGLERIGRTQKNVQVTVLLADPPVKDLPKARLNWHYQILKPHFLWTQLALPLHLYAHQNEYQVLFTPGHYAPRLSSIPYVSSVMDLGFLQFPEQFKKRDLWQLTDWTHYSVKRAAKVVTISEFTRQDVIKTYNRKPKDVVIAYPDVDSNVHPVTTAQITKVKEKFNITEPYFVYVGTLQPRKNILRLIEAFEQVNTFIGSHQTTAELESNYELRNTIPFKKVQLVLAGKVGWLAEPILERIAQSPVKDLIVLTGFIDATTKNALYQSAVASVLIGTYEGFGIPPLESMVLNTVPIVADATSLPEVVGKAGILVAPEDVASITQGLLTGLLLSAQARAKLRREAHRQIHTFSWQTSSQIIWDTLLSVADET